MDNRSTRKIVVIKLGGSVLMDDTSYQEAARFLVRRLQTRNEERLTPLGRKAPAFEAGDIRLFLFLPACLKLSLSEKDLSLGMAKSKASSLSFAEVRRLWEELAEEIGLTSDSVGIPAIYGGEDVKVVVSARKKESPTN